MDSIRFAICGTRKLKLKLNQVSALSGALLCVRPGETSKSSMHYVMQQIKNDLPGVLIKVGPDGTRRTRRHVWCSIIIIVVVVVIIIIVVVVVVIIITITTFHQSI